MGLHGETIVITGGAGFIGTALCRSLMNSNRIFILDNLSRDSISSSGLLNNSNIELIEMDICNSSEIPKSVFKNASIVIHLAAIAGIDTVIVDPVRTMQVNMLGSANIFEAARLSGHLKRLVNVSTSEIFGKHAYKPSENDSAVSGKLGEARWTYAVSKLAAEHLAISYFSQFKLPVVNLRPFNVYGPGQKGEGALSIFIQQALKDEEITIDGDGSQIRSWCYIDDFIEGALLSLRLNQAIGESFNIGNERATITVLGLANTVCRVLKSNSVIRHAESLSQDIHIRVPSIQKARETLGFSPRVDLEEGIRRTANYYASSMSD